MRFQRSVPSEINCSCNDVQIEPELQEITTEVIPEQSASTNNGDIAASGLWGRRERAGSSTLSLLQIALTTATPSMSVRRDMLSEKIHAFHIQTSGKRR